ncbi:unnamed protein product [Camellia sinensis]|uniref:DUF3741 domain-containing protein n=1 Tax=Camellia sinensis TaxID=4442 RepID=A0A7J7HJM3_CAMSI|nr:hypothetical protein HYC85_010719 [Camellia sinensis]
MKDLSLFLLKNSLGSKMRKGYRSFCNGNSSTSILNQRKNDSSGDDSCLAAHSLSGETPPTLEEMILQLELEEKMAKTAKLDYQFAETHRRMSCVNNSDILRSARNALNQYPRFSLDGKDAMYRSSFRNLPPISSSNNGYLRKGLKKDGFNSESEKTLSCLPPIVAGESVVWCKPGVVAKLMGLEAVPVPVRSHRRREKSSSVIKEQINLSKRAEKQEMERRKPIMGSCSNTGYCVMKPIKVEPADDGLGWPIRRFQ